MDERLIQKTPIVEKVNQSEGVTNYNCPACGKRLFSTNVGRHLHGKG